jgi:hypothetical protein
VWTQCPVPRALTGEAWPCPSHRHKLKGKVGWGGERWCVWGGQVQPPSVTQGHLELGLGPSCRALQLAEGQPNHRPSDAGVITSAPGSSGTRGFLPLQLRDFLYHKLTAARGRGKGFVACTKFWPGPHIM